MAAKKNDKTPPKPKETSQTASTRRASLEKENAKTMKLAEEAATAGYMVSTFTMPDGRLGYRGLMTSQMKKQRTMPKGKR